MEDISGEDMDTGGEGEALVPATDGAGTEFIWMGSVKAAFAFDANDDGWILATARAPRWSPLLFFEVPAVDALSGEGPGCL